MKVAIPTFGNRVSPRFDCAQMFLVVTLFDRQAQEREKLVASSWAPHERINKLVELGVDTLVCGGIDCWSAESLRSVGITVHGWVSGEIEDALAALVRGELNSDAVTTTGGRCKGSRHVHGDAAGCRDVGRESKANRGAGPERRRRDRHRGGGGLDPFGC